MRGQRPPPFTISPFMKDTKLSKGLHCEVKQDQLFDVALEGTSVRVYYMTVSYHYKFPRALESKFKQKEEAGLAKYLLLYLDVPDKNNQFMEIQKLALQYGYNLLFADTVEDCRDCLSELKAVYTGESKQSWKRDRPRNEEGKGQVGSKPSQISQPNQTSNRFYPAQKRSQ